MSDLASIWAPPNAAAPLALQEAIGRVLHDVNAALALYEARATQETAGMYGRQLEFASFWFWLVVCFEANITSV